MEVPKPQCVSDAERDATIKIACDLLGCKDVYELCTMCESLIKLINSKWSKSHPFWLVIGSRGICNRHFSVQYTEEAAKARAESMGKDYPYVQIIYSADSLGDFA